MKTLGLLVLPVVLFAIGVVCLAFGVANYIKAEHFFATATQAAGAITEYDYVDRGEYCALIVFQDTEGQRQDYVNTGDCVSNQKDQGHTGQQVTVYYDPADPGNTVQMRGLAGSEGSGLFIGLIAFAIFTLTALFIFLASFIASRRLAARATT